MLVVAMERVARVEPAVLALRAVCLVLRRVRVFGGVNTWRPLVIIGGVAVGHFCDGRLVRASRVVGHVTFGSRLALHCGIQKRCSSVSVCGATRS